MSTPDYHFDLKYLDYGFKWGPAEITRMISHPRHGVLIGLETDSHQVQISVSPGGRSIRFWVDGVPYVKLGT